MVSVICGGILFLFGVSVLSRLRLIGRKVVLIVCWVMMRSLFCCW